MSLQRISNQGSISDQEVYKPFINNHNTQHTTKVEFYQSSKRDLNNYREQCRKIIEKMTTNKSRISKNKDSLVVKDKKTGKGKRREKMNSLVIS